MTIFHARYLYCNSFTAEMLHTKLHFLNLILDMFDSFLTFLSYSFSPGMDDQYFVQVFWY